MASVPEAIDVLRRLGFPRSQQNVRSGLVLLALLDLTPSKKWSEAAAPLRGVTESMNYIAMHFGKEYAPNTRETVRRQTLHQFLAADLVTKNPDEVERPVNSPHTKYQITGPALELLRNYGSDVWEPQLDTYHREVESLTERWARQREQQLIPVVLPDGATLRLSPGLHNRLIGRIIDDFCPRWTPGAHLLYVGDTQQKFAGLFDEDGFEQRGVTIEVHGKMPDLVVHCSKRGWLVLIEAVTSHGPVDAKRHEELQEMFSESTATLIFVTAFLNRRTMAKFTAGISWETEVWIADAPSHLIHFDGKHFLGPVTSSDCWCQMLEIGGLASTSDRGCVTSDLMSHKRSSAASSGTSPHMSPSSSSTRGVPVHSTSVNRVVSPSHRPLELSELNPSVCRLSRLAETTTTTSLLRNRPGSEPVSLSLIDLTTR